jgi:hypothetical protein
MVFHKISPLTLYSEDKEEEAIPDMKALTGSGGDLPQEFWQETASWSPPPPYSEDEDEEEEEVVPDMKALFVGTEADAAPENVSASRRYRI